MRARLDAIVVGASLCALACALVNAQDARPSPLDLLREWRFAVDGHVPGKIDTSALTIAQWPTSMMNGVIGQMSDLLASLKSRPVAAVRLPAMAVLDFTDDRTINHFVKRAAMLHTDIAILRAEGDARIARDEQPSLGSAFLFDDGRHAGYRDVGIHWTFSRTLIDAVRPSPHEDATVRLWYVATAAYMASTRHFEDAMPHLDHARALFPSEPRLLVDSGAVHEFFASPEIQLALVAIPASDSLLRPSVRLPANELADAEALFKRALEIDGGNLDARIRLGRTLGERGRHAAAMEMLASAATLATEPTMQYLTQLLLGREAKAMGKFDAARKAFEAAASLFPRAQSPRLALSQLNVQQGNVAAARQELESLLAERREPPSDDPWWQYYFSHLRNLPELLAELRVAIVRAP